jgi:hypothetical protein
VPLSNKVIDLFYRETLVAVPMFYFVSLFLFFQKSETVDSYVEHRAQRIFSIFIFWSFIQTAIYFITKNAALILQLPFEITISSSKLLHYIMQGGPPLPRVGGSVFYFLFNLLLLVLLASLYDRYSSKTSDILFFFALSFYMLFHPFFFKIPYWRIDNFIIYIPLSHFMAKKYYQNMVSWKSLRISITLYLLFLLFEIIGSEFLNIRHGAYDKNSLQWGVISLFILTQLWPYQRKHKIIIWLSNYSLGLFALHKYWHLFFLFVFEKGGSNYVITVGDSIVELIHIPVFISTLMLTCLTILLFNRNRMLRMFIT